MFDFQVGFLENKRNLARSHGQKNNNLAAAKKEKNDEFYTQYIDIQKEMNACLEYNARAFCGKTVLCNCDSEKSNFWRYFQHNFESLGLKKLIATHYKADGSPSYRLEFNGLATTISPLAGNGDFRSPECLAALDEADIVATNPPFSLFREFVDLLVSKGKMFAILGNMNAITYKEVFPLIRENKIWLGATGNGTPKAFEVPDGFSVSPADKARAEKAGLKGSFVWFGNTCWFSNIQHGRCKQDLPLMTISDNLRFSKHKELLGRKEYERYDNYDAIEVPYTDAIPSDYFGVMGVPISFLSKHNPNQFEVVGITQNWFGSAVKTYDEQIQINADGSKKKVKKLNDGAAIAISGPLADETYYMVAGVFYKKLYARVLIKRKLQPPMQ